MKRSRHLLIITDAWAPQTNGVVTTLKSVIEWLPALNIKTTIIHPGLFRTVGLPGYSEVPLIINPWRLSAMIRAVAPDTVHIATEGTLGMTARRLLVSRNLAFTTSLHTKFPEYFHERVGTPVALGYRFLRWFHRPAMHTLCTTESHRAELERWGVNNLVVWGRGVDTHHFRPGEHPPLNPRPRLLYVGRVSVEKNIEAFLELDISADKIVVGDGPARTDLERRFPEATWLGFRKGDALVREYAAADAFVFPSRTDTFGLVMLEANSCGTPVAAYPVTGPGDVVFSGVNGALSEHLETAVRSALMVRRDRCRSHALQNGWERIAELFADTLCDVNGERLSLSCGLNMKFS